MTNDEDAQLQRLLLQGLPRRFERGGPSRDEPLPIDDADYAKEFPLTDEPSTCSRCGATYDVAHCMALELPDDGNSVWTYPSHTLQFAVRKCGTSGCNNALARRIA